VRRDDDGGNDGDNDDDNDNDNDNDNDGVGTIPAHLTPPPPPTLPLFSYLLRLGSLSSASEADGQVPSLIPNTELSNQLDRCAEEIRKIYAPLSEEDALEAKEINEGVDKAKENLDLMIRKVYKVGGKGGKKRKSLEGEGGGVAGGRGRERAKGSGRQEGSPSYYRWHKGEKSAALGVGEGKIKVGCDNNEMIAHVI
jgi:hypothetical protein